MAVSKCVSLSVKNIRAESDMDIRSQIDETGCNSTMDFPVAVYLDDVTTDHVNWHWHDEFEIGFVVEGSVAISAGTVRATLTAGEVFFVNSGVPHAMHNAGPGHSAVFKSVTFGSNVVGGETNSVFWQKYLRPVLHAADLRSLMLNEGNEYHAEMLSLLSEAWDMVAQEPEYYEMSVRSGLSAIFCILLRLQGRGRDEIPQNTFGLRIENRLHILLDYIHTHYSERITLDELAGFADISKTEVMRCFKSFIGKPPIRYLLEYRLQQAAYMLIHTERPVQQIGERCGFTDNSYFAKSFRELYRMTPSEYRRNGFAQ